MQCVSSKKTCAVPSSQRCIHDPPMFTNQPRTGSRKTRQHVPPLKSDTCGTSSSLPSCQTHKHNQGHSSGGWNLSQKVSKFGLHECRLHQWIWARQLDDSGDCWCPAQIEQHMNPCGFTFTCCIFILICSEGATSRITRRSVLLPCNSQIKSNMHMVSRR